MAESALALREHPQIIELLSVLEQHSLSSRRKKCRPWWAISTAWKKKLSQMMDEMKAMRLEVEKLHDQGNPRPMRPACGDGGGKNPPGKGHAFHGQDKLRLRCRAYAGDVSGKGRAALRHAVQALRIPAVLSRMERGFSHASQAMEQCAGKLDVIRDEAAPGGRPHEKRWARPGWKRGPGGPETGGRQGARLPGCEGCLRPAAKPLPRWAQRGTPCGKSRRRKNLP